MLCCIKRRRKDEQGQVIAAPEDYAAVRELVADLVAEGVEATIKPEIREVVEATARLLAEVRQGRPQGGTKPRQVGYLAQSCRRAGWRIFEEPRRSQRSAGEACIGRPATGKPRDTAYTGSPDRQRSVARLCSWSGR